MPRATARRVLWVAGLLLVPVPLMALADAFVPTARILELGLVVLITILVEGAAGIALLLLALFVGHAVVYAALLWLASWLVTWAIDRVVPTALGATTIVLVVVGVLWTSSMPVYDTPFHSRLPHATLLQVYP